MWPLALGTYNKIYLHVSRFSMRTTCPANVSSFILPNYNIWKGIKRTESLIKQFTLLLLHPLYTYIPISTKFKPAFFS